MANPAGESNAAVLRLNFDRTRPSSSGCVLADDPCLPWIGQIHLSHERLSRVTPFASMPITKWNLRVFPQ